MLTFDEKKHQYRWNGEIIPSATQLLKPLTADIYSSIDPEILKQSCERGKAVHKMVELSIKKVDFDLWGYDQNYLPYFGAFCKWQVNHRSMVDKITSCETITSGIWNGQRYGGTIDIVGEDFLIDIKTRECKKNVDIFQLMLYNITFDKPKSRLFILSLLKDGSFSMRELAKDILEKHYEILNDLVTYYQLGKRIKVATRKG